MSPASQTLRRRTTRPRRPRPVHSRNHQERPQEYKDRGAGGRRPLGRVGIMVVGAERRPRRLGDARREASLESWSWEPSGGRGGSATRAARRVWNHGRGSRGAAAEARRRAPRGESGIMVVGAEGRPRRLGDARREARLESCYRDPAMHSRWDDAEARRLEGLDLLVYASRLIGAETSLVVWGGGNTSIKTVERDHRRREVRVLRVKGSGSDLKSIEKKHFPGVRMDDILALLERTDMGDQEMVDYLAHALQEPASPRPSIETLLHGFLPAEAVIHTHADAIVPLTNNDRAAEMLREVYGGDVIALPYRRPGFLISRVVDDALRRHP